MASVKNYFSLVKFSHTIFALPFAIIGFFLGLKTMHFFESSNATSFTWNTMLQKLMLVLACMVTSRSAAMSFNRYLDQQFDKLNPRTSNREIPAGIISASQALIFTIISSILFLLSCYFINSICFALSPIALFVILFYSYTKRFTALCHIILGVGLSFAPIGAYLAVTGSFAVTPILFSLAVICWVSGFDIIYALQDEMFDKENNLYSMPVIAGKKTALSFSRLLHFFSALFVISAGIMNGFSFLYWIGILVFCSMLVYQQSLVKPDDISKVNIAFMTANGIASIVFGVFVCLDISLF
ncbi:MAG: 4-hydroxybenzoate octaprenyltransferase [Bacteroidetes bacterium]|nr:4-hydroxybenzoate octaprenyltransferase [Bacteroidota bacterium]